MKFGLIGKTLHHSFSAKYFTEKFEELSLKHTYENIELPTAEALKDFKINKSSGFRGFNVTIPYKEDALALCDELSAEAKAIGAVNCISVENGKWIGHNTDAIGFLKSIAPFLESQHSKALVFGTGGASKAIQYALKSKGIMPFTVSRTAGDLLLSDITPNHIAQCKLLVHCTPIGTYPNVTDCLDLPYENIEPDHLLVDLIYNPIKTKFLENGENQGACIVNGKAMLHFQAEASWNIWTKV